MFKQLSTQNKEKKYVELNMDMFRNNYMAYISDLDSLNDIDFAFLVYETPDNPCSERWPIQQWFKEHRYNIKEWTK